MVVRLQHSDLLSLSEQNDGVEYFVELREVEDVAESRERRRSPGSPASESTGQYRAE